MAVDSKFLQQISCTRKPILFVWLYFYCNSLLRGCSSVVERSLCMWKARGSIPRISTYFLWQFDNTAVVAEWLRRWTWNPMGSARVGSNPANCEDIFSSFFKWQNIASCGVWTHDPQFTRLVLYHWAKEALTTVIESMIKPGSVAEWSKALVLGTSPKGRGFESHHCQNFARNKIVFGDTGDRTRDISHAKRALYHWATSPPIGCHRYVTNWGPVGLARLAEWSKAWDLSSHNRKIAWVRTPHLAYIFSSLLEVH